MVLKITFTGSSVPEFRDGIVEHLERLRETARREALITHTQKETRYHEGREAAFRTVIDFLQAIQHEPVVPPTTTIGEIMREEGHVL